MHWDKETITVVGALLVAFITVVGNLVITWLTRKYEYKKALMNIVYDTAYKEWEARVKLVREIADKTGRHAELYPFNDSLLYYSKFMKLIEKKNVKESDIRNFFEEETKVRRLFNKYRKEYKGKGYDV